MTELTPQNIATRTIRLKVKSEAYPWLNSAASEVNTVFNFCNDVSIKASLRTDIKRKWMSGFDLCGLTSGATEHFSKIGSGTIQSVCLKYSNNRNSVKKIKLRWRVSHGARRTCGWIPFKSINVKRKGQAFRFCGKTFRVFGHKIVDGCRWGDGCFAQDSCGDWWLCLPIERQIECKVAPCESVGIDLGLKTIATTSDSDVLEAGRWTRAYADKLAQTQRRGHKKQAKRIHRKIARCRQDALHKFSRRIVDRYQTIVVRWRRE